MGSMLAGVVLLLEIGPPPLLFAAQIPKAACTPPATGGRASFGAITFEQRADGAALIVEAYVQSVKPGAPDARGGGPRENNVLLIPARVLKGPDTLGQFAAVQSLALNILEMQPGQHFILFLNDLNPAAQSSPERPGIPSYNVGLPMFCVDTGKIRVSPGGAPGWARFEGADLENAVADVRDYVRFHRVSGRIVAEGGALPLVGSRLTVIPSNAFDLRSSLRLVLTPVDIFSGTTHRPLAVLYAPASTVTNRAFSDSGPRLTTVDRNGAFTLPLDEGAYRVTVDGLPFGCYLKSISYGSRDLLKEPLRVGEPVPASTELLVTLTDKAPDPAPAGMRVSGRLTGIPAAFGLDRLWAVMISDASENIRTGAAQPSIDGTFVFQNVLPGSYTLKAFHNGPAPTGTVWGVPSTTSVVVSNRDVPVEMPLFAGAEVTAQVVDKNGNSRSGSRSGPFSGPNLTFFPVGGTAGMPIVLIPPALDGSFRLWLPRGEYSVISTVTPFNGIVTESVKGISFGSVDLLKESLKSDGVTPIAPIRITVEPLTGNQ